ncbi:MAG: plastocyanin/azurin family copper-binding protein [Bacteriovoracaceae bacterium]
MQEYSTNQDTLKTAKLETVKIKLGDSVTFTNVDNVTHNVYAVNGEFDLKTQTIGKSDTVKFDQKGEVQVRCGIHPKMKLTIVVE